MNDPVSNNFGMYPNRLLLTFDELKWGGIDGNGGRVSTGYLGKLSNVEYSFALSNCGGVLFNSVPQPL